MAGCSVFARVVLVGVGVKEDLKKLTRDFAGCFADARRRRKHSHAPPALRFADLGDVARERGPGPGPGPGPEGFSLKKLAAFHGVSLSHKTKALTMTNWEKPVLFPAEIRYAAQDADSGLKIARAMFENERERERDGVGAGSVASFLARHVQLAPA